MRKMSVATALAVLVAVCAGTSGAAVTASIAHAARRTTSTLKTTRRPRASRRPASAAPMLQLHALETTRETTHWVYFTMRMSTMDAKRFAMVRESECSP